MSEDQGLQEALALQARITAFIRAFGLLQPDRTPCGRPIPLSEAHAIVELESAGAVAQHDLAARLRLEKSTVSRLVGQLEERGWVRRTKRTDDGRVRWLELTETGRIAAAELAAARAARFTHLLDAIPPNDRQTLLASLDLLVEASRAHQ